MKTKTSKVKTYTFPALDKLAETYRSKRARWTAKEDAMILKYFRKVDHKDLVEELNKEFGNNRSISGLVNRGYKIIND